MYFQDIKLKIAYTFLFKLNQFIKCVLMHVLSAGYMQHIFVVDASKKRVIKHDKT